MNKKIIFLSILLFIIMSVTLVSAQRTEGGGGTTNGTSACIKEKQEKFGSMEGHAGGYIGVILKENVTLIEATKLIESYNLSIYRNKFPKYIGVVVLEGTELEWICILEENKSIVKHGTLIAVGREATFCGNDICELEENCENCTVDCECTEQSECVEGKCEFTERVHPKDLTWLWTTIIIALITLVSYLIVKIKK